MRDTVFLDGLRCDGSGHGGCQAACRIYWKDAWLRRVDDHPEVVEPGTDDVAELARVAQATREPCASVTVSTSRPGAARRPIR